MCVPLSYCPTVPDRGSDGPHGNGHSRIGLAYSSKIPTTMRGVGTLRVPVLMIGSRVCTVECDARAAAGLRVEMRSVAAPYDVLLQGGLELLPPASTVVNHAGYGCVYTVL